MVLFFVLHLKNDNTQIVQEKNYQSQGVIFASPVHSFTVSVLLKNFLDRFHPFYFNPEKIVGKFAFSVSTSGFLGLNPTLKYLDFLSKCFGFYTLDGIGIVNRFYFSDSNYKQNINKKIQILAEKVKTIITGESKITNEIDSTDFKIFKAKLKIIKSSQEKYEELYNCWAKNNWLEQKYYIPLDPKIEIKEKNDNIDFFLS